MKKTAGLIGLISIIGVMLFSVVFAADWKRADWEKIDGSDTKGYIYLVAPMRGSTNAALDTTSTNAYYGQALFTHSADEAANYVEYRLIVPPDIDLGVDPVLEYFKFRLSNADTGKHRYYLYSAVSADSATYDSPVWSYSRALDFAGDAGGASGDVESIINATLTGLRSNLTAGALWILRIARDGDDGTNDTSTVSSYSGPALLRYEKNP